ncbi:kinase-like protein [Hypoxylon sp. FL0890]|nr:kinase-like protein [Hypoxylon sp. FL0890]
MTLHVEEVPQRDIGSQDITPEHERQAQFTSHDADYLFGDPANSPKGERYPELTVTSTSTEAIPPQRDDPAYDLQWTSDENPFSVRPEWTVEPTTDSIILTLKAFIDQSKHYSVQHLWDGACNKIYSVSYEQKHYVMRVALPVCPKIKTESEVATLEWIRENTRLPVPKVKCYDSSRNSPVGFEWILMDRIDGLPLSQCWQAVTRDAKERIVKQIAEYATTAFKRQFEGIGNIYPPKSHTPVSRPLVGEMWTKCRLRLVIAELGSKMQDATSEGHCQTATKMFNLANRLLELGGRFFPTPEFDPNRELAHEDKESTDEVEDQGFIDKRKEPHEPTVLWHDAISLDNILVDENGMLCGVIDWACVSCLPLYEACQFPAFLQQARDRQVEPLTPHGVAQKQPDSKDILIYERRLRQHELTLLRQLFINEMMDRCPEWVHIFESQKELRDYEAAVQNCDNEFAYKAVERWVDIVEKGAVPSEVPWTLHERLMG